MSPHSIPLVRFAESLVGLVKRLPLKVSAGKLGWQSSQNQALTKRRRFYSESGAEVHMAARLPYVTREDLPEGDRDIFDRLVQDRAGTPVGHIFRTIANAPNLLRPFVQLGGELLSKKQLDPKLRQLALLTIWRIAGAAYQIFHH